MKLRQKVYARQSEDKLLQEMEEVYSSKALMVYGDWSRSTQMKGHCPTKGVGLRRLIAKRFDTVLMDEFRTSKLCSKCYLNGTIPNEVKLWRCGDGRKKFRCLVCHGCSGSESNQKTFMTRDLNSALNIHFLALDWIYNQSRPSFFKRAQTTTDTRGKQLQTETALRLRVLGDSSQP